MSLSPGTTPKARSVLRRSLPLKIALAISLITLLLISGVVIWRPYFAPLFSIPIIRTGLFVHALAGISLILLIIGHAYLAFWVKGSIRGMVTGYVSHRWAKTHHDRWYRQISNKQPGSGRKQ